MCDVQFYSLSIIYWEKGLETSLLTFPFFRYWVRNIYRSLNLMIIEKCYYFISCISQYRVIRKKVIYCWHCHNVWLSFQSVMWKNSNFWLLLVLWNHIGQAVSEQLICRLGVLSAWLYTNTAFFTKSDQLLKFTISKYPNSLLFIHFLFGVLFILN